jgi:hypothetical protein
MRPMIINTRSSASPIQNGQRTQSHDHEATGGTARSLRTMKIIPTTPRQLRPVDFADLDMTSP